MRINSILIIQLSETIKILYYKVYSNKVVSLGDSVSINREYTPDGKNKNENDVLTVLKTKIYLKNNLVKSEFLATDMKIITY